MGVGTPTTDSEGYLLHKTTDDWTPMKYSMGVTGRCTVKVKETIHTGGTFPATVTFQDSDSLRMK